MPPGFLPARCILDLRTKCLTLFPHTTAPLLDPTTFSGCSSHALLWSLRDLISCSVLMGLLPSIPPGSQCIIQVTGPLTSGTRYFPDRLLP